MTPEKRTKLIKLAIILFIIYLLFHWIMKFFNSDQANTLPIPVVVIQKPKMMQITDYVTQTGNTVAYNSVDLVARIEGYLQEIKFIDGTFIEKGKELFVIEPKPYLEKLKEAQASVTAQKAIYAYDSAEYERQKRMYKQNATSQNNVEKWYAKSIESQAEIDKTVANAEIASINYSYTHVIAPFNGRIGRHLVDVGNLVGHGQATDLATIEQINPIYVYFNLNELDLLKLREAIRNHDLEPRDINQIPVYVGMQNEVGFPHEGKLNFVNTGLNASTGTIEFRALLTNKKLTLLPGLFVQVRIPLSKPKQQLTIPNVAVQYDQIGPYVLTVDKNNIVIEKRVQLGTLDQETRVITKGLNIEDCVVVDGLQNATPNHAVKPVQSEKK
jgi:RND family efflux transporter MFP subunit